MKPAMRQSPDPATCRRSCRRVSTEIAGLKADARCPRWAGSGRGRGRDRRARRGFELFDPSLRAPRRARRIRSSASAIQRASAATSSSACAIAGNATQPTAMSAAMGLKPCMTVSSSERNECRPREADGELRLQTNAGGARERNARKGSERTVGTAASGTIVTQEVESEGSGTAGGATAFCSCEDARHVPQLRAAPSRSD